MGIEEDIDRLRGLGEVPTRAPETASWWWTKRYLLLGVGMAVSLGATLALPRLAASGSDQVTAGPGTTTTAAPAAEEADPGDPAKPTPETTAPPAASGDPEPEDPSSPETTTTTRRSTPQPTRSGSTPVTAPPATTPPTTAPSGPPWRANPISIFPPGTIVAGQSAEFGVSVRGIGNLYQVAFGDGSSTGSASTFGCDDYSTPSAYRHTFDTPGRYTFIVRIHGSGSCSTRAADFRTTTKTISFDVVAA